MQVSGSPKTWMVSFELVRYKKFCLRCRNVVVVFLSCSDSKVDVNIKLKSLISMYNVFVNMKNDDIDRLAKGEIVLT